MTTTLTNLELAHYIDHTLLRPDASAHDIERLCAEARQHQFYSVCVNPCWVAECRRWLKESSSKVCTVVGFPLGSSESAVKAFETTSAIAHGADEIDMVMNLGWAKSSRWDAVAADIRAVVTAAGTVPVKVILETSLLSDDEKVLACQSAVRAGAAFVKTSTGFSSGGATVADVTLLRKSVGDRVGVKASGGIRDRATFLAMVAAGADRIGTSSGCKILAGEVASEAY